MSQEAGAEGWGELVQPMVRRWRLAASLNMSFTQTPEGLAAQADLIEEMARRLDWAVKRNLAENPDDIG